MAEKFTQEQPAKAEALLRPTSVLRQWACWCVLFVISIALHIYSARADTNPDPFTYGQYGKQLLAGESLYDQILLDKPVLVPLIYALPQVLFPRSYLALKVMLAIVLAIQSLLFLVLIRPRFWAGLAASALLMLLPLSYWDWEWPSSEHFSNLWIMGVLLACWRTTTSQVSMAKAVVIGVLLGLGFLTRPATAVYAAVPIALILTSRESWQKRGQFLVIIGVTGLAILVASVGLVALLGSVHGYLYVLFVHPYHYAAQTYAPMSAKWLLVTCTHSMLLAAMILAAIAATLSRFRVLLLVGLACGLLAAIAPNRAFEHYLAHVFPATAIAIGCALSEPLGLPTSMRRSRMIWPDGLALFTAVVFAAGIAFEMRHRFREIALKDHSVWVAEKVAERIDDAVPKSGTLWVVGPMFSEKVRFASRRNHAYPIESTWELDLPEIFSLYKPADQILIDYLNHPPTALAIHSTCATQLGSNDPSVQRLLWVRITLSLLHTYNYRKVSEAKPFYVLLRSPLR